MHPARAVGRQEQQRFHYILRRTGRPHPGVTGQQSGIGEVGKCHALQHFRSHRAGGQHVDPDRDVHHLHRQRQGQADKAKFGRCIGRQIGLAHEARGGRDADDIAMAFDQVRHRRLHQEEGAGQVGRDGAMPLCGGDVRQLVEHHIGGDIAQHVKPPERRDGRCDRSGAIIGIAQVEG